MKRASSEKHASILIGDRPRNHESSDQQDTKGVVGKTYAGMAGRGRSAHARPTRQRGFGIGARLGLLLGCWRGLRTLFSSILRATVVSRGGRLYVRCRKEYAEIESEVRVIVASGFGFVITGEAIGVCVRRHIEIIITSVTQSFAAIYAPYAPWLANRACLAVRAHQFAAITDRDKTFRVAKDIVRRKIIVERHDDPSAFLAGLAACKTVAEVRHIEARSAQEWWYQWRNFKTNCVKGFRRPSNGELSKQDTSVGHRGRLVSYHDYLRRGLLRRRCKHSIILPLELQWRE